MEPVILTYSGVKFDILDPDPSDVKLIDIAHSLARLCRFTGHTAKFYSVAEHCVRMSHMVSEEYAMWALLHDATEAYVGDMSMPLKRQPCMAPYRRAEYRVWVAICKRFDINPIEPVCVKNADREICKQEGHQLIDGWWRQPPNVEFKPLECWSPRTANAAYIARYYELAEPTCTS